MRYHLAEIEIQLLQFMIFNENFSLVGKLTLKAYLQNCERARNNNLGEYELDSNLNSPSIEEAEFNNQSLTGFLSPHERNLDHLHNEMEVDNIIYSAFIFVHHERIVLRKILSYMLLLSKYVCTKMKTDIKYCIAIEKLIKELLLCSNNIDFFHEKHLDQVVLCCIITVLYEEKIGKSEEIISKVIQW